MKFTDAVTVAGTRRTEDGYLIAEARAVRTGIQLYAGDEVGKPEMKVVKVYRPAESVFADASLQSFTHAPVTNDHPAEQVTAENWKDLAIGEVSTAAKKDGEWVMLPLILKDAKAIKQVEDGKRELSAGYVCELDWTNGVTADGQAYDAIQKNIKINHLALVDRARAGSKARIGDSAVSWGVSPVVNTDERNPDMPELRKMLVDGLQVETTDAGAAAIEKLMKDKDVLEGRLRDLGNEKASALAAKDAELAKKDAEIDSLKGKILSDADLDKRVQARGDLVATAKAIAKDVKTEGLSDAAIRKAVVAAKLGDAAVADKTDAYIDARFDILVEDAKKANPDPFAQAVAGGVHTHDANASAKAYDQMVTGLTGAWQNPSNGKAA